MKIIDVDKGREERIQAMRVGQVFLNEGIMYIKTSKNSIVNLSNGTEVTFGHWNEWTSYEIIKTGTKLTIEV